MSDFGTRLERELVQAAHRERARARRGGLAGRAAGLRPLTPALVAAAAVAAVLFVLVPRLAPPDQPAPPGRPGPVPAALAGSYARGDTTLILDRRRYTLLLSGSPAVTGTVTATGPVLAFDDDGEGACPASLRPARYLGTLSDGRLQLRRLADGCKARARAFEQPLLREK